MTVENAMTERPVAIDALRKRIEQAQATIGGTATDPKWMRQLIGYLAEEADAVLRLVDVEAADIDDDHSFSWLDVWQATSSHVHAYNLDHDAGVCSLCRNANEDAARRYLGGQPIVCLHVIGQPIASALTRIVSLWTFEVGHPDLREWPIGDRNLILTIYAHAAHEETTGGAKQMAEAGS